MVLGLAIGYVEAFGYLDRIIMGLNTAAIWEQKASCARFQSFTGKPNNLNLALGFVRAQGSDQGVGFIQPARE